MTTPVMPIVSTREAKKGKSGTFGGGGVDGGGGEPVAAEPNKRRSSI